MQFVILALVAFTADALVDEITEYSCPLGDVCTRIEVVCPVGIDCQVYRESNITLSVAENPCLCPPGTYCSHPPFVDINACIACPPQALCSVDGVVVPLLNYVQDSHSVCMVPQSADASAPCSNAVKNAAGVCGICLPGFFADISNKCQPCPVGTYKAEYGSASSCDSCIAGSYSNIASAGCYACGSGTYSSANRQSSCIACGRIRVTNSPRYDACVCTAGSRAVANATDRLGFFCESCAPAHWWSAAVGACFPCPAGSVLSTTLLDTCVGCPPGLYSPAPASMMCLQCDVGTYSSVGNQSECGVCVWPAYISNSNRTGCVSTVGLCGAMSFFSNDTQTCMPCLACLSLIDAFQVQACTGTANTVCAACTRCDSTGGVAMPRDCGFKNDRVCSDCMPGTYLEASPSRPPPVCVSCPLGSFEANFRSRGCGTCEDGFVVSVNRTACVAYDMCGGGAYPGLYYSNQQPVQACTLCPISTYGPGDGGCYPCSGRWDAGATGVSACLGCVPSGVTGLCVGEAWALPYT